MHQNIRTDLALEARQLWQEGAAEGDAPEGVETAEEQRGSFLVSRVKIQNEQGEKALCKPKGDYITITLDGLLRREENAFADAARLLAEELRKILALKDTDTVLVAGLGNRGITPDAIGPGAVEATIVTRHLKEHLPRDFAAFRSVAAVEPGVLGTTGVESADMIRALTERVRPNCVIAVDALAARGVDRLCRTVQIADTGIVPGSGVDNARAALSKDTLGVPVIAVGVPTVVDAATLARDVAGDGCAEDLPADTARMMVTPRDIDSRVKDISRLVGYALNLALHDGLTIEDVDMLLS